MAASTTVRKKKLLVLDVNGLLVATYHTKDQLPLEPYHVKLGNFYVYKRPACEEFLKFCFENFVVGVWSSAQEHNVNNLVDFVLKDLKSLLAFSWHQIHCTRTNVMHPDNDRKPIFLKELSKVWALFGPGEYGPSNSLLVDDSPYKALKNPPNTGIFPRSYTADQTDDKFLMVLRPYLEGVRDALDVQRYVEENPIGEPGITAASPLWSHYSSLATTDLIKTRVGEEPKRSSRFEASGRSRRVPEDRGEKRKLNEPPWKRDIRVRLRSSPSPVKGFGHARDREVELINSLVFQPWHSISESRNERIQKEGRREREDRSRYSQNIERLRPLPHPAALASNYVVQPHSSYTRERNAKRDDVVRGYWPSENVATVSRDYIGGRDGERHREKKWLSEDRERLRHLPRPAALESQYMVHPHNSHTWAPNVKRDDILRRDSSQNLPRNGDYVSGDSMTRDRDSERHWQEERLFEDTERSTHPAGLASAFVVHPYSSYQWECNAKNDVLNLLPTPQSGDYFSRDIMAGGRDGDRQWENKGLSEERHSIAGLRDNRGLLGPGYGERDLRFPLPKPCSSDKFEGSYSDRFRGEQELGLESAEYENILPPNNCSDPYGRQEYDTRWNGGPIDYSHLIPNLGYGNREYDTGWDGGPISYPHHLIPISEYDNGRTVQSRTKFGGANNADPYVNRGGRTDL